MFLSPTYYDFIRKVRPFLVDFAQKDAEYLLTEKQQVTSIHSVDDYKSNFEKCINEVDNELIARALKYSGLSKEQIQNALPEVLPMIRGSMASLYQTVNLEYHSLVNFFIAGKKTFYYSDNLSEHLANTEVNVQSSLIKLPFNTCLFVFTSHSVIDAMYNMHNTNDKHTQIDYSAPISAFLTLHEAKDGLPGNKIIISAWHAKLPDICHLAFKRELYLSDDWTLEQSLRTDWETLTPENLGRGMSINSQENTICTQDDDKFYTDGLLFFRIILNAILYISSDQPELIQVKSPREKMESEASDILSHPKRRKAQREAAQFSTLDYHEVGGSVAPIVISNDMPNKKVMIVCGSKPLVRFMVRGHWRLQPYGQARLNHKLIWIKPYYKGDDLAETINKPYIVR